MESIPTTDRIAKAEAFLESIAKQPEDVPDQEALVYLCSRGRDCKEPIAKLTDSWREAERATLGKDRTATDVLGLSRFRLPDFWANSLGDYFSDATMLRTADWGQIPGFEPWWQRLVRDRAEEILGGGAPERLYIANYLFAMARSDYALRRMPTTLGHYLDAISLTGPNARPPWRVEGTDSSVLEEHIPFAAAIVFAHHRLARNLTTTGVVQQAAEAIAKLQEPNGAWRTSSSEVEFSIESTAMAVHALALGRPRGWRRMMTQGRDWLCSVQNEDGFWVEKGSPGSCYLTVLVLDAIALANEDSNLTFGSAPSLQSPTDQPDLSTAAGRTRAIDAYIYEVLDKMGVKIKRHHIWKKAGYKSRSDFERWERADPKATKVSHLAFVRILTEKPHLK